MSREMLLLASYVIVKWYTFIFVGLYMARHGREADTHRVGKRSHVAVRHRAMLRRFCRILQDAAPHHTGYGVNKP